MLARHDSSAVCGGRIVDDLDPQLIGDTTISVRCPLEVAQLSERVVGQDLPPDGFKIGETLSIVGHHSFHVDIDWFDSDLVGKSKERNWLRTLLPGPEAFMLFH